MHWQSSDQRRSYICVGRFPVPTYTTVKTRMMNAQGGISLPRLTTMHMFYTILFCLFSTVSQEDDVSYTPV